MCDDVNMVVGQDGTYVCFLLSLQQAFHADSTLALARIAFLVSLYTTGRPRTDLAVAHIEVTPRKQY